MQRSTVSPTEIDAAKITAFPATYLGTISPSSAYSTQPPFPQGYGINTSTEYHF